MVDAHADRLLTALFRFYPEFRHCGLVREVKAALSPPAFKLHPFIGLMISARTSDLSREGKYEELEPLGLVPVIVLLAVIAVGDVEGLRLKHPVCHGPYNRGV